MKQIIIIILLAFVVIILAVPYFTENTTLCEQTQHVVRTYTIRNEYTGLTEEHVIYDTEMSCKEER